VATPPLVVAVKAESVPVPVVTLKVMVSPSATTLLLASVTSAVIVLVLVSSAARLLGVAVREIVFTAPGIKLTDVSPETPPAVAVIVADPTLVGLVRVAVAIPLVVVAVKVDWVPAVTLSISPAVAVKVTVLPLAILLSAVSFIVAVIRVLEAPSATILEEPALTETEPTVATMSVILTVQRCRLLIARSLSRFQPS